MMRHNATMHPSCLQELTSAKKDQQRDRFFCAFCIFCGLFLFVPEQRLACLLLLAALCNLRSDYATCAAVTRAFFVFAAARRWGLRQLWCHLKATCATQRSAPAAPALRLTRSPQRAQWWHGDDAVHWRAPANAPRHQHVQVRPPVPPPVQCAQCAVQRLMPHIACVPEVRPPANRPAPAPARVGRPTACCAPGGQARGESGKRHRGMLHAACKLQAPAGDVCTSAAHNYVAYWRRRTVTLPQAHESPHLLPPHTRTKKKL